MAEMQPDSQKDPVIASSLPTDLSEAAFADSVVPVSPPLMQPVTSFVEPIMEGAIPARAMYPFGWSRRDVRRTLGLILAGLAAGYFFFAVWSIVVPFLISFFLAAILDPTVRSMERRKRSRVFSIGMIYLLTILSLILMVVLLGPPLTSQVDSLSKNYESYYTTVEANANKALMRYSPQLSKIGIKGTSVRELLATQNGRESWIQRTSRGLLTGVSGFVQEAASKLFWLIIIPIATFFFLRDFPLMRARIISLFPEHYHDRVDEMSHGVVEVFGKYIKGLARICALYGVAMCVFYGLAGLKYSLFLGLMAGVFYAMPYIGQIITAVVVGAVAYSMDQHTACFFLPIPANSAPYAITLVLVTILMNNLFDQIVYPIVVGGSVGLHPILNIFALAAGATLFGIWGMLLAVPVAASIQIVVLFFFPKLSRPIPPRLLQQEEASSEPEGSLVAPSQSGEALA